MEEQYTAVYVRHGDWIVAYLAELPGVNVQGRTEEEARESLEDALREFHETRQALARDR